MVAHFHFIMVGAHGDGLPGGAALLVPEDVREGTTRAGAWWPRRFIILGFNVTFIPQFLLGNTGMPRRYYEYPERFQALNVASTAGASLLAFGFVIIAIYLTYALVVRQGRREPVAQQGLRVADGESRRPTHNFVGPQPIYPEEPPLLRGPQEGRGARCSLTPRVRPRGNAAAEAGGALRLARGAEPRGPPGHVAVPLHRNPALRGPLRLLRCYRFLFPEAFAAASRHLDLTMGTVNTVVLITSSLTAAMAVHYAKEGKNKHGGADVRAHHRHGDGLPRHQGLRVRRTSSTRGAARPVLHRMEAMQVPGIPLFFTVYFLSTGLHAFHVIIGMIVLGWVMAQGDEEPLQPRQLHRRGAGQHVLAPRGPGVDLPLPDAVPHLGGADMAMANESTQEAPEMQHEEHQRARQVLPGLERRSWCSRW